MTQNGPTTCHNTGEEKWPWGYFFTSSHLEVTFLSDPPVTCRPGGRRPGGLGATGGGRPPGGGSSRGGPEATRGGVAGM